jgi:hypothetical protein
VTLPPVLNGPVKEPEGAQDSNQGVTLGFYGDMFGLQIADKEVRWAKRGADSS